MSPGVEEDSVGPALGASRVGTELQAARLRLGWSLLDVSQHLRIRLPFLEALEQGRIAELPGAAYAIGFVRAYAGALGLDPDEVARRFRAEAQEVNRKPDLHFPAPVPERGVPAGAAVLLGLVLAAGAYGAWYKSSDNRRAEAGIAAVPERLAPLASGGPAGPSTVSPQVASILPSSRPLTASPAHPATMPASPVISAPTSAAAAPIASALPLPVQVPVPVPMPVAVVPPAPPPTPTPPAEASRVVLRFKADSRVQVREKGGPVLLDRVMRAGETWPVPSEKGLVMTTRNAGATEIVVDGVPAARLGPIGAVRRDVPLDPDAFKPPSGTKLPPRSRRQ